VEVLARGKVACVCQRVRNEANSSAETSPVSLISTPSQWLEAHQVAWFLVEGLEPNVEYKVQLEGVHTDDIVDRVGVFTTMASPPTAEYTPHKRFGRATPSTSPSPVEPTVRVPHCPVFLFCFLLLV